MLDILDEAMASVDAGPEASISPTEPAGAAHDVGSRENATPASKEPSDSRPSTSYFSIPRHFEFSTSPSESAADAAKGAKTPAELLRRLSLTEPYKPETFDLNPQKAYPGLKLSGNIISASICLPYQFKHQANNDWKLLPRKGTSALFDSFAYIASALTPWNHTLVGWTGEISPIQEKYYTPSTASSAQFSKSQLNDSKTPFYSTRRPPLDVTKSSAAIPPSGMQAHVYNPATDTLCVSKADRERLDEQLQAECSGKMVPIWLPDDFEEGNGDLKLKDQGRWRRYAEHELYTLFHYRQHAPDDGRAEKISWKDYLRMNQIFAEKIIQIYKPGDIIWIHDYHLMLLPNLLRQRMPEAYIGFFLHVPFPSSEYMRCLPRRKDVLSGPLGATMVGFQSYNFARHFNSCCKRILGFESSSAGVDAYGAHVAVDVFPIGIDVVAVQKAAFDDQSVNDSLASLRKVYAGKKLIVGRDRLDTVRGVSQKLQAFEIFLDRYPEWRDNVILIQVTSPTSVQEEKEDSGHKIESKISSLVSRINGEFGSLSHTPVQHYPQYLDTAQYFALLRLADVGLITSVRDGMNTTSLEYIICQKDNYGPLILSEFSGTAASLANAIHINPWDLGSVADTLNEALLKSKADKKADHDRLYEYVTTHTVSTWTNNFLKRLLTNLTSFSQSDLTPVLDRKKLLSKYHSSSKRLFMFDYDGTLTPIVKDPNAAIPTDRVLRTLKALAEDHRNNVWIISGRDASFLEEWMGHIPELGLSAEHGCFLRRPGSETWENLTESMDMDWQKEVFDVFSHYTERTPGSWIERKRVALTWHYRQVDPDFGSHQARECKKVLEDGVGKKWDVEVMSGKANLEVRPTFVNKGFIANRLVEEYGYQEGGEPPGFVLCMGDDTTDERKYSPSETPTAALTLSRHVRSSPQLASAQGKCLLLYSWRKQ
jgi:trehalose 6-phosphate synthase/phosphatase